jgi:hypothetical protein
MVTHFADVTIDDNIASFAQELADKTSKLDRSSR